MRYGDLYKQALERARTAATTTGGKHQAKRLSGNLDALDRIQCMVNELRAAGAPVIIQDIVAGEMDEQSLTLGIGDEKVGASIEHMAIKVYWRGPDKTPMVYHCLSQSRLNALAKAIVHRAIPSALIKEEEKRMAPPARVIRLP